MMILESEFKFSHLYGKCFTYLSHFPSLVTLFLITILYHPKLKPIQNTFFLHKTVLPLNVFTVEQKNKNSVIHISIRISTHLSIHPFIYYFSRQGFSVVLAVLELWPLYRQQWP